MFSFFVLNETNDDKPPDVTAGPMLSSSTTIAVAAKTKIAADRDIYVARYGKIYKRKAPSPVNSIKLICKSGFRYCKLCDEHKPLVAFYTSVKRYVCRKCHKERVFSRFRQRTRQDVRIRWGVEMWNFASDHRIWFGYSKLEFDHTDLKDIVLNAKIPWEIRPVPCPIDPTLPLRPRNIAILSHGAFHLLFDIWKHSCSRGSYIAFVQRCNLIPRNFDVASPCDPYHNPEYLRPIISVDALLLKEYTDMLMVGETHDHNMIQHMRGVDIDATPSAPFFLDTAAAAATAKATDGADGGKAEAKATDGADGAAAKATASADGAQAGAAVTAVVGG